MSVELDNLDPRELQLLVEKANKLIEVKKKSQAEDVRKKLLAMARDAGYDLHELFNLPGKSAVDGKVRRPARPKYLSPTGDGKTWTGRGLKPKWVVAHLEGGGTLESLLIK